MTPSESEYIEVPMRCGRKFRVDREAFARIKDFNCSVEKDREGRCYVVFSVRETREDGSRRTRRVRLSRFLKNLAPGDPRVVDHWDGDTMNNCDLNLRVCTVAENSRNQGMRSNNKIGLKGVSRRVWKDGSVRFIGYITVNRKRHNLGGYLTPEEAHVAYCEAAKILHGEFANFGERPASYEGATLNDKSWVGFTLGLRLRTLERHLVELDRKRRVVEEEIAAVKRELVSETAGQVEKGICCKPINSDVSFLLS